MFPKTALFRTSYLLAICAATLLGVGCAKGGDLHKTIKSQTFQTPGNAPVMLAAYQAWFGHRSHINVGYSSQDRVVIQQQMERAKQLGIAGFVVNWYGPVKDFEDRAYAIMQEVASANNFQVALLYDESEATSGEATDTTIRDLQYAYNHYIGSNSQVANSSYLRYNGRPVIFIFPKGGKTDWNKVRHAVDQWQERPLLIYKDANPKYAQALDGFYAWVHPGKGGWQRNGSNWGRDYLDDFYVNMTSKYPDKIAVGAAWPGFDDSKASWSRNRKMDARCGKTLEDSLRVFRRYYDDSRPLPYLMIDTWNDYEEGTAIERGTVGCGNDRSASFDPAKRSGGGD